MLPANSLDVSADPAEGFVGFARRSRPCGPDWIQNCPAASAAGHVADSASCFDSHALPTSASDSGWYLPNLLQLNIGFIRPLAPTFERCSRTMNSTPTISLKHIFTSNILFFSGRVSK